MKNINSILNKILILKTNIKFKKDLRIVSRILNNMSEIECWTVDQHDVDNVLRITSKRLTVTDIISILREAGYYSEELPD